MKWPSHTDYQDAIQNPELCFDHAELKAGQPAADPLGLPRVMSGNFASVYELVTPQRRLAVRCFVRQVSGTQARYLRLSEHLGSLTLPWLVEFEFVQQGIRVQSDWYPIVKMHWVEGCPINTWVEENVNQSDKLLALAEQFRTLVNDLRKHKIAHGDFQHGNIMVTPEGELRLVDYDGMFCPAFGKGRSPELGHANFQHPLRLADYYDESLDNFSALVTYSSLLALAAEPELWKEFYTGDNLIFTSNDFRNAQNSPLFARLKNSKSEEVQQLAAVLQQASMSPVTKVPWFEETIAAAKAGSLKHIVSAAQPAAATTDTAKQPQRDGWWENAQEHTTFFKKPAGSRPAPTGTQPAPASSGGTRPAEPIKTQTRPAPAPAAPAPQPSAPVVPFPSQEKEDSGSSLAFKLKVAAAIIVLIGIFWYALAASKARSVRAQEATTEAVDGN